MQQWKGILCLIEVWGNKNEINAHRGLASCTNFIWHVSNASGRQNSFLMTELDDIELRS